MAPQRNDKFRHRDFSIRMQQACESNSDIPLPNFGRLAYFVNKLADRGIVTTHEAVRKWLSGLSYPRSATMKALAEIMQVDEVWLATGRAAEIDLREQKLRSNSADGLVNVIAGFIQMHGGSPTFPDENDQRAKDELIDIYAIIRGVTYSFHVTLGRENKGTWLFYIPAGAKNTIILGVLPVGDFAIEIVEIDAEGLKAEGKNKVSSVELEMTDRYMSGNHRFHKIENFRSRL